ncbi:MAG: DUF6029 family protein, partial [Bacteroidota bacterium]
MKILIALFFGLLPFAGGYAQISGSNFFEFQYGNLPFQENRDLTTAYNQLNLFYDQDYLSASARIERFDSRDNERSYFDLSQALIQYQDDQFNIRVGNFYETLGRGILLRSFDIPGSVFEDEFNRVRYGFFRDLEGISGGYTSDRLEVKAMRVRPLFNPLPPNFEPDSLRRREVIDALQGTVNVNDALSVGGVFMRIEEDRAPGQYQEFGSLLLDMNLASGFQVFGEYAFNTQADVFAFKEQDSYGLYTGVNYFYQNFGVSLEYKDYNNILVGSGVNDPPTLIKEHTYPVLNRSTHVPNTSDERGSQLEAFYNFDAGHSLVFNYARTVNEVFNRFDYEEYFLEGLYQFDELFSIKGFIDYANDEPKAEADRYSFGLITDKSFDYRFGITTDLQFQTFERTFSGEQVENYYASLALAFNNNLTISGVFEASSDPNLTDNPTTFPEIETDLRTWFGMNALYRVKSTHTIQFFAGKRRGGPACTSGICYEIL